EIERPLFHLARTIGRGTRNEFMQRSAPPSVEDDRIDIRLAAHGWRIGKLGGHSFDRSGDASFAGTLGATLGQWRSCEQRYRTKGSAPRAKILGCEVSAHGVAQIIIHLVRCDGVTCAFVIDVLKQLLSRQLLAAPNETYQASIVHRHLVRRATLAPKLQAQPSISNEPGVPVAKRCEPI